MKRFVFFLLLVMLLSACSTNEETANSNDGESKSEQNEDQSKEENGGSVEVDKGLLNVEINIPASMFEGEDLDTVIANAKAEGVNEVTKNADGSLTYKMSKTKHKEFLAEMKDEVTKSVNEMKNSEDFVSIVDITSSGNFSEFTMIVDKAAFENSMDGFAALGLGLTGMMYQLYEGVDSEEIKVVIKLQDEATGEVFDEVVYPDDMEE
ncbi:MAG: hypothetical protein AB2392_20750 [Neobacillus sp.]